MEWWRFKAEQLQDKHINIFSYTLTLNITQQSPAHTGSPWTEPARVPWRTPQLTSRPMKCEATQQHPSWKPPEQWLWLCNSDLLFTAGGRALLPRRWVMRDAEAAEECISAVEGRVETACCVSFFFFNMPERSTVIVLAVLKSFSIHQYLH